MSALTDYAAFHARGADLLADIHAASRPQLIALGFTPAEAVTMKNLAKYYYGPCRSPGLQRDAVDAARANGHSLATLAVIRKMARKCLGDINEYELVKKFCRLTGSHADIEFAAAKEVEELNQRVADRKKKAHGRRSAVVSKQPTADGLKSIQITGPADDIDKIAHALREGIRTRMNRDRKTLRSQATYDELLACIFGPAANVDKLHHVIVPISLSDYHRLQDGDGDDIRVACTDGQILTGTELLNTRLADDLYIGLVHPVDGPANLYRAQRLANTKQRILAKAENPVCPAPNCTNSADDCEIHHLTAWDNDGHTNISDLASVCRTDNGRNDDDPDSPRNGRFERRDGTVHWVHPDGTAERNRHPAASMGLMDLV